MIANLLAVAGVNHVITLDLHASQMQGFFKCPVDNLFAEPLIARWIKHNVPDWQEAVVVSKNPGGTKRVTSLADALKLSFGIVTTDRRRPQYQDFSTSASIIFENFGIDGASDDDPQIEEVHLDGQLAPQSLEDKHVEAEHKYAKSRKRTISNLVSRGVQTGSSETPSSPLVKSAMPGSSPDHSRSPSRLARTDTAAMATSVHEEATAEEFIDEVCIPASRHRQY